MHYKVLFCLVSLHGDQISVQYNVGFLPNMILLTHVTTIGEPDEMPIRGFVFAVDDPTYTF